MVARWSQPSAFALRARLTMVDSERAHHSTQLALTSGKRKFRSSIRHPGLLWSWALSPRQTENRHSGKRPSIYIFGYDANQATPIDRGGGVRVDRGDPTTLVNDRILQMWQSVRAEARERAAEANPRTKGITEKLDRLDEAFLFVKSIDQSMSGNAIGFARS
jgi:hypothetical protein